MSKHLELYIVWLYWFIDNLQACVVVDGWHPVFVYYSICVSLLLALIILANSASRLDSIQLDRFTLSSRP